tara:strand:- start:369 stop:641 length:273 start_codon:yes stop_codon:yes gene_type:complete
MINDNPARVAPPEPPKGFSMNKAKMDLIDLYLDSDKYAGIFQEHLETYIVENGLIHHWMRKVFTKEADQVEIDMQDVLYSVAVNYIESDL